MDVYKGERGAPENTDLTFKRSQVGLAVQKSFWIKPADYGQPMVRTHPVTGLKTLFAGGLHCRRIDGVSETESQEILAKILHLVTDNHDLQVRFRWNTPGDMGEYIIRAISIFRFQEIRLNRE